MPEAGLAPPAGFACYALNGAEVAAIAFAVFGLEGDALTLAIDRIVERQVASRNFVPLFLTDCSEHEAFRRRGYAFEYFPKALYGSLADSVAFEEKLFVAWKKWNLGSLIDLGPKDHLKERLAGTRIPELAEVIAPARTATEARAEKVSLILSGRPGLIAQLTARNQISASLNGSAKLDDRGWLRSSSFNENGAWIGPFGVSQGGLIRARIDLDYEHGSPALQFALQTGTGIPCGPEFDMRGGENEYLAFTPLRTQSIKVHFESPRDRRPLQLAARQLVGEAPLHLGQRQADLLQRRIKSRTPGKNGAWRLKSIVLEALDADWHHQQQKEKGLASATASLASIPSREEMLADSVASLLPQADTIRVFLNGWENVPAFLAHPRIEVRRSQDWDDRGDAGKFFWIDRDNASGYKLAVDDDLIYPPDFTATMVAAVAKHDKRAIVGVHGIVIRQPLKDYYDLSNRAKNYHFESSLVEEMTVHILGTGAVCFHNSTVTMRAVDFLYSNSADVWLALHAQKHQLPMFVVAHPSKWIRENVTSATVDTIYKHSASKTKSRFDSSMVQTAALKHAHPITFQPSVRPKIVVCAIATDHLSLNTFVETWRSHRGRNVDWVLVVASASRSEILLEAANSLNVQTEVHVLPVAANEEDALFAAGTFAEKLAPRYVILARGDLRLLGAGWWETDIFSTLDRTDRTALLFGSRQDGRSVCLVYRSPNDFAGRHRGSRLASELLLRRAAGPVARNDPFGTEALWAKRISFDPPIDRGTTHPPAQSAKTSFNEFFSRIVYINLDRRPDRRRAVEAEFARHGISAERFSAFDGGNPSLRAEYDAYAREPLRDVVEATRPAPGTSDFFLRYDSQAARVASLEQTFGAKAIRSAGAWAYLRGWQTLLEHSLENEIETLLVFDDDILLHRNTNRIFSGVIRELPSDWLVLQLGTLQYHWNPPWVEWRSKTLYQTNGHAVGSHAVGLRFEAMVYLLDRIKMMEMPMDVGALSSITRDFSNRCFVVFPNVAIQSLADSDIGTSDFQKSRSVEDVAALHRWQLSDYGAPAKGLPPRDVASKRDASPPAAMPDYVADVQRELARARLAKIKRTNRVHRVAPPILICVLKNEITVIQAFMQHYRETGIEQFIFIDNGSTDGTFEYLRVQPDTDLFQIKGPFDWRRKQAWIHRAMRLSDSRNGWFLYADADEFIVFDGIGERSFADLTEQMASRGITRCRGMLVDMYAKTPLLDSRYSEGPLIDAFPYFDASGYDEALFEQLISRKGGPRRRTFGHLGRFNPELSKYPLFRLDEGELFANPHHIWPYDKNFSSLCYLGILHFKFLPGLVSRIAQALGQRNYWDNSREYQCYNTVLSANPKLRLFGSVSKRYIDPSSLVKSGLIEPIDWSITSHSKPANTRWRNAQNAPKNTAGP